MAKNNCKNGKKHPFYKEKKLCRINTWNNSTKQCVNRFLPWKRHIELIYQTEHWKLITC